MKNDESDPTPPGTAFKTSPSTSPGTSRRIVYSRVNNFPEIPYSHAGMDWNHTGSWSDRFPIYETKLPPCAVGCPIGTDIPAYFQLVRQKKYQPAWELLRDWNPMPAICGRVCYHPCESQCNRKNFDEAVGIQLIERFIGDYGLENNLARAVSSIRQKSDPPKDRRTQKPVAIIGSGPAGLACAYHLARAGYSVTIFEALAKPGGMLRVGIPDYRLPERVLDAEIDSILVTGIRLETGVRVGSTIQWSDLKDFGAIFIAVGAHLNKPIGIPEEDSQGVLSGLEFLRRLNLGHRYELRKKEVLVVGGGNTAIDVARCAIRLGAQVSIVYRRATEHMPALPEEVHQAQEEGVKIIDLAIPKKLAKKQGKITGLVCQRVRWVGEGGPRTRKMMILPNSEFTLRAAYVITATGQDPDISFLPPEVQKSESGILTDQYGSTNQPSIFAGGDVTKENRMVSNALGMGRRAARAISAYLEKSPFTKAEPKVVGYNDLNTFYFLPAPRRSPRQTGLAIRLTSFREITQGLSESEMLLEVNRCFSCATCTQCDNCLLFCPDLAISRNGKVYTVKADFCKGCGICAQECPRGIISLYPKSGAETIEVGSAQVL